MPIPEISKLNWSTVKPTFEEVKGKTVTIVWRDCECSDPNNINSLFVENIRDFDFWFDDEFIRYAIIDVTPPDPEPLPLWGVMPEIVETVTFNPNAWYASFDCHKGDDTFSISTFGYPTRAEAIAEWNKIAAKLNEIE